MKYLLDTHYLLWSIFDPVKIPKNIEKILLNEDDIKYISTINLWEISLKYGLGKLEIEEQTPEDVYETALQAGYEILNTENKIYSTYYKLSKKEDHRDPFDRMLIWQAINNDLIFITADKKTEQYKADGLKVSKRSTIP